MTILQSINPKSNILISILFAALLITSVNIEYGMGVSALLMLIVSIFGLYVTRKQSFTPLENWEKYWIASIICFVGVIYIDVLSGYDTLSIIDSQSRLMLAIPVYLYVRRVGVNINVFLFGLVLSGFITGAYSFYQYSLNGLRVDSITNAVYYGGITMTLLLVCLVSIVITKNNLIKLLLILASACALYSSILSGTRGAWIVLPLMFCIYFRYNIWNFSLLKLMATALLILITFIGLYQSSELPVKSRIDVTFSNIAKYSESGQMSSVGSRLEMWKASWLISKSNNFMGNGADDYQASAKKIIKKEQLNKTITRFKGPHSQYFESLVNQGILGLIALLFVIFVPIYAVLKKLQTRNEDKIYGVLVLSLLVPYVVFMVSISAFEIQILSLFYAFTLALLLGLYVNRINKL